MDRVAPKSKVTIRYRMETRLPDGTVKEHGDDRYRFIFGVERQVPTLERALEGCALGEVKSLHIPPSEIYGAHDPELIREIPKRGLIRQRLQEGRFYRRIKGGSLISFKILEVRPDTVLADFNRPMAGIEVSMDLEVLDIQEASDGEIDRAMEARLKRDIGCG